jgi:integrase
MYNIEEYLASKKGAWSTTTIKSTSSRLIKAMLFISEDLHSFYDKLLENGYHKYTIRQIFTQVASFYEYYGDLTVKNFIKKNALLFKNTYEKEKLSITFEEAVEKLNTLKNESVKRVAFAMLRSGLRAKEALNYDGSGSIIGKGAKRRTVFIEDDLKKEGLNYSTLYNTLSEVGLKPHSLRKLAATRLVDKGFREADLMAVMGWSSIQTASIYLQSTKDAELKNKVTEALNGK